MSVSLQDWETLEEALDTNSAAQLDGREPQITAALAELRSQRAARAAVWAALEPSEAEADRFIARVTSEIHRHETRRRASRPWRAAAAIAACLAVGFFAGWSLRGKSPSAPSVARSASHAKPVPGVETVVTYQVALTDERGHVTAVQNFDSLDQAREFARDVGQWQERQRQLRDGAAVIVADQY